MGGSDRITRTVSDAITEGGADLRRTRTYLWQTNGSTFSNLISTVKVTTDGLRSWRIALGRTNETITVYTGDYRYVTNIAPDSSYSVAISRSGTNVSFAAFDAANNQLSATTFACDAQGRLATSVDARNGATVTSFNNADQVSSVQTPAPDGAHDAQTTTSFFDQMGRVIATRLSDGSVVTNKFDVTGLLTNTFGSRTYPVGYSYDPQGRLKTMTTWQNFGAKSGAATTTWNYNPYRGWLDSKVYADNHGPSYTYTPAGRLQSRLWARGVGTTNSYSAAGDLAAVQYSDTTPGITNTYDRRGLKIGIIQGDTTTTIALNDAGLPLTESYSGGALDGLGVTNVYDNLLRRTNLSTVGVNTVFGYDIASRLASVRQGTNSATYTYVPYSPLVGQIEFSNANSQVLTTAKQFDLLNRLTNTVSSGPGALIESFSHDYNDANQRTKRTENDGSYFGYQYDVLGQVVAANKYWSDGLPVAGQQFEYSFDDIGNRISTAIGGDAVGSNLRSANYSANALNEYTSRDVPGYFSVIGSAKTNATVSLWTGDGYYAPTERKGDYYHGELALNNSTGALWMTVTNLAVLNNGSNRDIITNIAGNALVAKNAEQFTYDLDGNLTSDGRWTNTWDAENRLIQMESLTNGPAGSKLTLTFTYDSQWRRRTKLTEAWTGSGWICVTSNCFVYDGWNLVSELNATNKAPIRTFTWRLDISGKPQDAGGSGGLLLVSDPIQGPAFVLSDGAGNVSGLVKATDGSISACYRYGPFGEPMQAMGQGAKSNPIRFSTKYEDEETGLLYYGFRYYNPSTGRWLSHDPITETGGENLYGMVGNNAVSRVDYLGLWFGQYLFGDAPTWIDSSGNYHYDTPPSQRPPDPNFQDELDSDIAGLSGRGGDVQKVCKTIYTTAHTALDFTPQSTFSEAVLGEDLRGDQVGIGTRVLAAGTSLPGGFVVKKVVGRTVTACCGKVTICLFIQRHHLIPKARFKDNQLIKDAGVNLETDVANLMDLVNHGGDHSGNYYDTVDDLLKQAQNDYQAGKLSAREAYERVCKTLREGITDGSIKPYKSKEVSPVP